MSRVDMSHSYTHKFRDTKQPGPNMLYCVQQEQALASANESHKHWSADNDDQPWGEWKSNNEWK